MIVVSHCVHVTLQEGAECSNIVPKVLDTGTAKPLNTKCRDILQGALAHHLQDPLFYAEDRVGAHLTPPQKTSLTSTPGQPHTWSAHCALHEQAELFLRPTSPPTEENYEQIELILQ